jgi:ABC-type sugar transport system ATPase subunit
MTQPRDTTTLTPTLLEIDGVTKAFPGVRALDDVSLTVRAGEIVGLAGANGSGKSTLIKILAGYHDADAGRITAFGEQVWPGSTDNWRRRCHFIHQDLGLVPTLSVAENLALTAGYVTTGTGRISWRRQRAAARSALARFDAHIDVRRRVESLTPGERTIVAMARALHGWASSDALLIVDEPTAALHRDDVDRLFTAVSAVADAGAGVIFVSHRLQEVFDLTHTVVVLRDGRVVATVPTAGLDSDTLIEHIVGRPVEHLYVPPPPPRDDVVLSVRDVAGRLLRNVSFDLHESEILGVTGLIGSGREELPGLLYGTRQATQGEMLLDGNKLERRSPEKSMRAGLVLIPAERLRHALVPTHSVLENVSLSDLRRACRGWHIDRRRERAEVREWIERLDIRPRDVRRRVAECSGGNQQKVVLAKWLRLEPRVMVLDEPTQGVDVGAKALIYRELAGAARRGTALIVCSSEAKELAAVCDRVLIIADGEVVAELHGDSLDDTAIVRESVRVREGQAATGRGGA